MVRQSTIRTHPQVELIERAISEGVPAVEIARRYNVSPSAIARHKSKRLDALAQVLDDDTPDTSEVLGRIADLADSATRSRKLADVSGTASVRARAQTVELSALSTLLDRLGVDDLDTARMAQGAGLLVQVIRQLVEAHPDLLPEALRLIREQHEDFSDLADALAAHMRARKQKTA
ncbi:hypothetical protein [Microbacterium sp. NPDC079176]|uniref:hypothetical protein n=1 Tax=Microbacterium sp. NPDC079176 TaxID=3154768 RepID=UPI00341928FF